MCRLIAELVIERAAKINKARMCGSLDDMKALMKANNIRLMKQALKTCNSHLHFPFIFQRRKREFCQFM